MGVILQTTKRFTFVDVYYLTFILCGGELVVMLQARRSPDQRLVIDEREGWDISSHVCCCQNSNFMPKHCLLPTLTKCFCALT